MAARDAHSCSCSRTRLIHFSDPHRPGVLVAQEVNIILQPLAWIELSQALLDQRGWPPRSPRSRSRSLVSSRIASDGLACSGATVAAGIALVTRPNIGEHIFVMGRHAALEQLAHPALRADLGRGGDEQFHVGIGRNHRADVAAVEDRAAGLRGKFAAAARAARPDRRIGRNRSTRSATPARCAAPVVGRVEARARRTARNASNSLAGIAAPAPQIERDRAVKQAGIHVRQAEMRRRARAQSSPCRSRRARRRR